MILPRSGHVESEDEGDLQVGWCPGGDAISPTRKYSPAAGFAFGEVRESKVQY